MIRRRCFSLLAFALLATPALAQTTFQNPIITQRADGQAYQHSDGFFYYMGTVPEYDRLELRRAKTIQELGDTKENKVIWKKHATGQMGSHIWAPEIHNIDGKWFVYFAAGEARDVWKISMFALQNDSPNPLEGEWVEKGQIKLNWNQFALDFTTFVHNGVRYGLWAERDPAVRSNSNLYIAKMDTPTSIVGQGVKICQPEFDWEIVRYRVNEGPAVINRNGKIFLTYSASATDANYCMGMLTADEKADLLDPKSWVKSKEPVLKTDEKAGVFGPGHNSFLKIPDGKGGFDDVIFYHARSYKDIKGDPLNDPNRCQRAQVIKWNPDGTPNFMPPVPDAPDKKFPKVAP
jgi:GH43 family beta-xylosidase